MKYYSFVKEATAEQKSQIDTAFEDYKLFWN